jgi:DNA repair photolyase
VKRIDIQIEIGANKEKALAPVVVSASRATDIPAFYAKWLKQRLEKGYLEWLNPFNQKTSYISFQKMRAIVFWTKNPKPLLELGLLEYLDTYKCPLVSPERKEPKEQPDLFSEHEATSDPVHTGVDYYFQFTLNDYEDEGLEPVQTKENRHGVPPLRERIDTFKTLSEKIGKKKVIWRFDPLLVIPGKLEVNDLLRKIEYVGEQIKNHTEKLVISFADIAAYKGVQKNLKKTNAETSDMNEALVHEIAAGLKKIREKWQRDGWNIAVATCAEKWSLEQYGIDHNHCIDEKLIGSAYVKDKGQRTDCGCLESKDIGQYHTCPHACAYCYANYNHETAKKNYGSHKETSSRIIVMSRSGCS